jgi:hypothetical protein
VFAIFIVAIVVMLIGFLFVLSDVWLAIKSPGQNTAWIVAISAIITEFIGVTFMVIYRSTMARANRYVEVLERMNVVGMAVQVLEAIPEAESELKNKTRAEMSRILHSAGALLRKPIGVLFVLLVCSCSSRSAPITGVTQS